MKKNLSTYVINAQFFPALVKDGVKYKSPEDKKTIYHLSCWTYFYIIVPTHDISSRQMLLVWLYHQSLEPIEMLVFLRKLLTDYGYQDHNKYGNIA